MLVSRLIIYIGTRILSMIQIIEGAIAQVLTLVPLTYCPFDSPSILPRGRHSSPHRRTPCGQKVRPRTEKKTGFGRTSIPRSPGVITVITHHI
eukprot:scaffold4617_cov106-Cylindrotheca_fusiformis.AAC.8